MQTFISMSYLMYKWHTAINDKHVLFGVFLCTSLCFSYWMISNTKEKQRTGRQRIFPPRTVSDLLVRAPSGKSGWYIFELSLLNVNQVMLLFLCNRLILLHPFTDACSQSHQNFFPLKQSQQTQHFIPLWKQKSLEGVKGKELDREEEGGLLRCFGWWLNKCFCK